jgi:hypothetical protein
VTEPQGEVAAVAPRLVRRVPVLHTRGGLLCGRSLGSFGGLRHAVHRWLSGWVMAEPAARFRRRQEQRGDLCTKPRGTQKPLDIIRGITFLVQGGREGIHVRP